jgi:hypothetical protein
MSWESDIALGIVSGRLPHATGRFYDSNITSTTTTFVLVANTLYAVPIMIPKTNTYTTESLEVSVLAGGKTMRYGIYTDTNGAPNALVLDSGTTSAGSTGARSITISQQLTAGWYWMAVVCDGTPTVRALTTSPLPWLGFSSGTDTTFHAGWSVAFTYAALPNPFTGGGALMTTAAPRLMLAI